MAEATRAAYGETLVELVNEGYDIMAVDADLSGSTTTGKLAAAFPSRHVNVGIAEQNMIDVAAGLSLTGKTVFTGSFAVFGTGRAYDQIRNTVCYSKLNVKVAPTHAGITVGPDGGSHQMLEDIALMRVLPNMRVLVPADYKSAKSMIRLAATEDGPFYVRLGRAKVAELYGDDFKAVLGGSNILKEGSDVSIFACGIEVAEACKAAEILAQEGISAEVIDLYSIKPIDAETICASVSKTGYAVTCEEHSVLAGMGSAVAEVLSEKCPTKLLRIGMQDRFGTSAPADELLERFGLNGEAIAKRVKEFLGK